MLIRILASGQVLEMYDQAAQAKIDGGMAVRVIVPVRETSAIDRAIETGAKIFKETFRKPDELPGTPTRQEPNQVVKDLQDDEQLGIRAPKRRVVNVIPV